MAIETAEAYLEVEAITRREARNFSYGIRLLRPPERRALSAIYAVARRLDDIGDGDLSPEQKRGALEGARGELGDPSAYPDDPVLVAISDASRRYPIPMDAFFDLASGVEADVDGRRYETLEDLVVYCRQVAGSVGRLTLGVIGCRSPERAVPAADALGVALQLTNILRDVREDQAMGRVYLPLDDLRRFGCEEDLGGPPSTLAQVVAYEVDVARQWFAAGLVLLPLLDRQGRSCVGALAGIYWRLLCRIARRPAAVLSGRLRVPDWEKAWVVARSLAGAGAGAGWPAPGSRGGNEPGGVAGPPSTSGVPR
jgi:phytoene synthase